MGGIIIFSLHVKEEHPNNRFECATQQHNTLEQRRAAIFFSVYVDTLPMNIISPGEYNSYLHHLSHVCPVAKQIIICLMSHEAAKHAGLPMSK